MELRSLPKSRWQAFALHLALSCAIGGVVLLMLVLAWYPPPLFGAGGGARLAGTIVAIDVVLGPLLTLVVYRVGKAGLRFDLTCIALVQAGALAYGLWVAAESRPVYLVATLNRVTLVHANELFLDASSASPFDRPGWTGPRLVYADAPDDPEARTELLFEVLDGYPDADYRPALYRPIDEAPDAFWQGGQPLSTLAEHPAVGPLPRRFRDAPSDADLRFLPLITRKNEIILVFDAQRREVLGAATAPGDPDGG